MTNNQYILIWFINSVTFCIGFIYGKWFSKSNPSQVELKYLESVSRARHAGKHIKKRGGNPYPRINGKFAPAITHEESHEQDARAYLSQPIVKSEEDNQVGIVETPDAEELEEQNKPQKIKDEEEAMDETLGSLNL